MGYVSEFSPDGRLFGLLDSDGKLKIWDVKDSRLSQEFVPNLHLSDPYTCFVWFAAAANRIQRTGQNNTTPYIALGTRKGGVDLYSYATGKVESRLKGSGHAGAVTFICLHNDSTLYTSGQDCQIIEWSLANGSQQDHFQIGTIVPTCIVSLPLSNSLLVGCKELYQWSLDRKHELIATFTGHSADVRSMKMLQLADRNEEYVVTTAKSNREIYLWKIGTKNDPKGTFLMEYAASFLSCSVVGKKLTITAVTDRKAAGGVVHLFVVDDISKINNMKHKKPKATIAVAFDSVAVTPIPIVAATTSFSASKNVLIGYGSSPTIRFEDIKYNPDEKIQTLERDDPRLQMNRPEKHKDNIKTIVPITNDNNTQYHAGVVKSKSGKKSANSMPMEISLDDRLKTLGAGDGGEAQSQSMVNLLMQALHNKDERSLRYVLSYKDDTVIRTTLKRLPAQFVSSLVDQLTILTQKKTANVQIAVRWLKLLLQIHSSQLMALGKDQLDDKFRLLIGIIQLRTECLIPLTQLSGRLDFLLNQIKRNTDDDDDPAFNNENVIVYEDQASDDDQANGDLDGTNSTDNDDDVSMTDDSDDDMNDS